MWCSKCRYGSESCVLPKVAGSDSRRCPQCGTVDKALTKKPEASARKQQPAPREKEATTEFDAELGAPIKGSSVFSSVYRPA